jgi:ATP-dependent Zn protease
VPGGRRPQPELSRAGTARRLHSQGYLTDLLAVRLGGRAAEPVVFGEGSTGAANDLAGTTQVATRMVRELGLSNQLGPVGYATGQPQYLGEGTEELLRRPYSDHTQQVVDEEVAQLLRDAEQRAIGLLRANRPALDRLGEAHHRGPGRLDPGGGPAAISTTTWETPLTGGPPARDRAGASRTPSSR